MDTTALVAAGIGGGGAVIVGVVAFGASLRTTMLSIGGARDASILDRRAAIYVDAIAAVRQRQLIRQRNQQTYPLGALAAIQFLGTNPPPPEPDWDVIEAGMLAFGSRAVITAVLASGAAHDRAMAAYETWITTKTEASMQAVVKADDAADVTDDSLFKLIRTDLQGQGAQEWQRSSG